MYFELWVRPDLARALVAAGRVPEAREHVERCRSLLAGEDWRGRAGHVDLAEAVVLAADGGPDAAFAAAEACFARHELRGAAGRPGAAEET